jgi:hypothetical protein
LASTSATRFSGWQARQLDPAPRQFGDEVHALGVGAVADHVGLAALAAPGQVLEADGRVMMRPSSSGKAMCMARSRAPRPCSLAPSRLVVLGADRLQHRDIAAQRAQVGLFRAGLGKAGGVDHHFGLTSSSQASTWSGRRAP